MADNGKMSLTGGLDAWAMYNNKSIEDVKRDEIVKRQNEAVDRYKQALDAKVKTELEKAQEVTEKMNSMEIMPAGPYVLVQPYAKNPYEKIEVTNSGLIIPTYEGDFKNPDTGEDDKEQNFSRQGTVIEVGPLVKWIQPGDDVYYRLASSVPIPFFKQGFEVVPENSIQCVINEGVKARWAKIKGEG